MTEFISWVGTRSSPTDCILRYHKRLHNRSTYATVHEVLPS